MESLWLERGGRVGLGVFDIEDAKNYSLASLIRKVLTLGKCTCIRLD
jgi:hypothetical protein